MNTVQKITKNTLILFMAQAISMVLGIAYTIHLARELGSQGFGTLSFALAFTGVFILCADLGLNVLTTRDVSRQKSQANKYLWNVLLIKVFLFIVTFGLILVTITNLNYPDQTIKVVQLIALSSICVNLSALFHAIFQSFEQMEYISLSQVLTSLLMYIGIFIAIKNDFNIIYISIIYFAVSAIILGLNSIIYIWRFPVSKIQIDWGFWKYLLKESLPFWIATFFVIIYYRIDTIMISLMKDNAAVGFYSASYKLIDALSSIASIFSTAMFPVFSKYYLSSKESMNLAFQKSLKLLILLAIPIGIGTTLLADQIIYLIYGIGYSQSVIALQVLIWASVLGLIDLAPWTLLNSTNNQRILVIYTLFGVVFNVTFNYMLIPSMSFVGAAISTVATELIVGVFFMLRLNKINRKLFNTAPATIVKSIISGFLMGIFILIFNSYSIFLLIPLAAIVYFVLFFVIGGFEKDDFELLSQILGR